MLLGLACALACAGSAGESSSGADVPSPSTAPPTPAPTAAPAPTASPSPTPQPAQPSTPPTAPAPTVTQIAAPASLAPAPPCVVTAGATATVPVTPALRHDLAPAWRYLPAAGRTLAFDGVSDADGNLYWVEADASGAAADLLVSVDRDGRPRWRVAADRRVGALLLVSGGLLLAGELAPGHVMDQPGFWDALVARRLTDGAVAWARDVLSDAARFIPPEAGAPRPYARFEPAAAGGGVVFLPGSAVDVMGYTHAGLLRIDLATGVLRGVVRLAPRDGIWVPSAAAMDESGRTYLTAHPSLDTALLSFDLEGNERFAVGEPADDGAWLVAAASGLAFQATTLPAGSTAGAYVQWNRAEDGAPLGRLAGRTGAVVAAPGAAWVSSGASLARIDLARCALSFDVALTTVPPATRTAQPTLASTSPIATATGALLVLHQVNVFHGGSAAFEPGPAAIVEIGAEGAEQARWALPADVAYGGVAALHGGRFVVATTAPDRTSGIAAFDLDGRTPAAHGWVTQRGSMARDGVAR